MKRASGPALQAQPPHRGRVEHRHGHAGEPLGQHDVPLAGRDDRLLVGLARAALRRRDEARPELSARVAERERPHEVPLVADAARAQHRQAEARELVEQRLRRAWPRVPARAVVDRHQAVDAGVPALLGPLALGHVVVDDAARRGRTRSTTQRGLPSEVTKKRTPSSSATSIQRSMRSR